MPPPLSSELAVRPDGLLYRISAGGLWHPIKKLRLPQGQPNRFEYVLFLIW